MLPTLLLVHHDAVMRSLLIRAVQASGVPVHCIHQAANADEATRILHAASVDVLLLDVTADASGAAELFARSRDPQGPSFPSIVVMSGDPAGFKTPIAGLSVTAVAAPCAPGDLRAGILAALHASGPVQAP